MAVVVVVVVVAVVAVVVVVVLVVQLCGACSDLNSSRGVLRLLMQWLSVNVYSTV